MGLPRSWDGSRARLRSGQPICANYRCAIKATSLVRHRADRSGPLSGCASVQQQKAKRGKFAMPGDVIQPRS